MSALQELLRPAILIQVDGFKGQPVVPELPLVVLAPLASKLAEVLGSCSKQDWHIAALVLLLPGMRPVLQTCIEQTDYMKWARCSS